MTSPTGFARYAAPVLVALALSLACVLQQVRAGSVEIAGLKQDEVNAFFSAFQEAVRLNEPKAVSEFINFPLNVNSSKKKYVVKTRSMFIRRYKDIMTSKLREQILATKTEQLWANWQGVMIGNGELWFASVCQKWADDQSCISHKVLVITINQPDSGSN